MLQEERWKTKARKLFLLYGALPVSYVIAGRLGLLLATSPGYASAVFLPAGIAVGATFIAGTVMIMAAN
jgi:integral membrane sensor domain MASE1